MLAKRQETNQHGKDDCKPRTCSEVGVPDLGFEGVGGLIVPNAEKVRLHE